ncbi:NAD-dependent epimerase [Thomasclavelia spiroformis]|uniref:NAD-dependent epimerase n=1 Tax=Thomasclavelia spiroformis TaxID=29348 RepID=A0A1Y4QFS7_9FIRM|nr:NAD-dependent epimerase/dehydratase family protein [Thomasclavelia spiroformis]OUQ04128.1 NAD-dependent epimerase [Thomasclavelia spiroformis]
MKKILITGANSYIGTSFEKYIYENYRDGYQIDTLDMIDPNWKEYDFSSYDSIFHVAGIAHADVGNVSKETEKLYYQVNCDLAYETALKAKKSKVKQFIYMSSIIVYGESAPYGKTKIITKDTKPKPANFYGDSKLQAEIKLSPLQDDSFNLVIIRPPMIYGKGSKGNYPMLSKLAKKLPVFPKISNQRSVLYVENLCEFVRLVISNNDQGIYYPQNSEYASTTVIVKTINPEIRISGILNPGVFISSKVPGKISGLCNKAFGNLVYEKSMSQYSENYCRFDLRKSIEKTEVTS